MLELKGRIYNVEGISNGILLHNAQPACLQTFSLVRGGLKPPKGVAYGIDLHTHPYLKEHRLILYSQLLLSEQLFPHLREIDTAAETWMRTIADREQAHEIILKELVYD